MDTKELIERLRAMMVVYPTYSAETASIAATTLASQAAEIERLREALQGLTAKLEIVHGDPRYRCVWELAQMAQGPYAGPTYTDEFAAARAALNGEKP